MKFVHIADMHFDSPFVNLSDKDMMGEQRRLEQRKNFKKIIEYIKENNIDCLFIAGDLYEEQYIRKSTIEYINKLFIEIPNTKIYITPGNHDPYLKNSYYNTYKWSDNVKIFKSNIEKVECNLICDNEEKEKNKNIEKINIWGYGFEDFYSSDSNIENIKLSEEDLEKINILIMHADLDASIIDKKIMYNPVKTNLLRSKKFDYVALGHIHKREIIDNRKEKQGVIAYPGSVVSLGFDELGSHGMIVGEILNSKTIEYEYIELDTTYFKEVEIDVSKYSYIEDVIEKINSIEVLDNEFVKIVLIGKRSFEIKVNDIFKLIENNRILKVKDMTKLLIDTEEILKNFNSLKAIFLRKMLEKLEKENISDDEIKKIEKAIEIGLDCF